MDSKVEICDSVDGDNRTSAANRVSAFWGTGTTNPGGAPNPGGGGSVEAALEMAGDNIRESSDDALDELLGPAMKIRSLFI